MPDAGFIRNSFTGGEVSPSVYGRSDVPAIVSGMQTIRDWIVTPQGGLLRRPGTRYVSGSTSDTARSELVPFIVSTDLAYMLEFTDYKCRVFYQGSQLLYSNVVFENVNVETNADQFSFRGHGFYHGQKVQLLSGTCGGLSLSTDYYVVLPRAKRCTVQAITTGEYTTEDAAHYLTPEMGPFRIWHDTDNDMPTASKTYFIESVSAANKFFLEVVKGSGTKQTAATQASGGICLEPTVTAIVDHFRLATDPTDLEGSIVALSGSTNAGTIGTVLDERVEFETPYTVAEIPELEITQKADVMILFHQDHPPYQLSRYNTSAFRLARFHPFDGPYGAVSPLGVGGEIEITNLANEDKNSVGTMQADSSFFRGTDLGLPIRKRFAGKSNGLIWTIGRIERLTDSISFLSPRVNFFDQPGGPTATIPITAHGFTAGELVWLKAGSDDLPSPLLERTPYYVLVVDANNIQLEASVGGGAIILSAGTATDHKVISSWLRTVNGDTGAGLAHSFEEGWDDCGLWAFGELPCGLDIGYGYKVVVIDSQTVKLTKADNSEVPLTSEGHGKFWINATGEHGVTDVQVRWTIGEPDNTFDLTSGSPGTKAEASTDQWRIGAWGASRGWPGAGAFSEQRLVCAGSFTEPNRIWGSFSGDQTDFAPDTLTGTDTDPGSQERTVTDASGFSYRLDSDRIDTIRWLAPVTTLIAGTSGPIYEISASTNREAMTPANLNAEVISRKGSNNLRTLIAGSEVLYVGRYQTQILAAAFDVTRDTFAPENITKLADHVLSKTNPVLSTAFQTEPWPIAWICRQDGQLWGCTYDKDEGMAAWHHHRIGGSHIDDDGVTQPWGRVESVAVIPAEDGTHEQLWMVVQRRINGANVRFIEYLTRRFDADEDQEDAYFVDAGPAPYNGAETPTLTGFDHLEGETVDVWADGATQPQKTVSSGGFTLEYPASKVSAGLRYTPRWLTLPMENSFDSQTTIQGFTKAIQDLHLHFYRSLGGSVGRSFDDLEPLVFRDLDDLMDTMVPIYTGGIDLTPMLLSIENDAVLAFEILGPEPCHLTHLFGRLEYAER